MESETIVEMAPVGKLTEALFIVELATR